MTSIAGMRKSIQPELITCTKNKSHLKERLSYPSEKKYEAQKDLIFKESE